ncbi:MAG: GNAT family N-acetyltransferase [Planctomycetota bacterium]|nr:MAG: GNAT family N-acetyltransferase [Planctomycetota bacterium]
MTRWALHLVSRQVFTLVLAGRKMRFGALDEIYTRRLALRRTRRGDLDDYVRLFRDPRVAATLGPARSAAQTAEIVENAIAHWQEHGFGLWTARDRPSGAFVGRGGLRKAMVEGRSEVEVAYALTPEYWGRGLATELAIESVRAAFAELQLAELVCFTTPANRASQRVMEKAGFRYERDITHADLPHVLYRHTQQAWEAGI